MMFQKHKKAVLLFVLVIGVTLLLSLLEVIWRQWNEPQKTQNQYELVGRLYYKDPDSSSVHSLPVVLELDLERWEYQNPDKTEFFRGEMSLSAQENLIQKMEIRWIDSGKEYLFESWGGWDERGESMIAVRRDFGSMIAGLFVGETELSDLQNQNVLVVAAAQKTKWSDVFEEFSGQKDVKDWLIRQGWQPGQQS